MKVLKRSVFDRNTELDLPYVDLQDCLSTLSGIEPIDYFFAQYILSLCAQSSCYPSLRQHERHLSFHLLLALSFAQRLGNSCLMIDGLADKLMWSSSEHAQLPIAEAATGYQFPESSVIQDYLPISTKMFSDIDGIKCIKYRLYTEKFYYYERSFCEHLLHKMSASNKQFELLDSLQDPDTKNADIRALKTCIRDDWPALFAASAGQQDTDWQQLAVMNALLSKFAIISGGAGTGKTYTVSRLLIMLVRGLGLHPRRIGLVAPTGKAANRLASSLQAELSLLAARPALADVGSIFKQLDVQTVHRLLGIHPIDGRCKYHEHRLLPFDCLILDEASMVDLSLMHKLLRATNQQCKFIMVGDPNQLPSVEAGCLLADLVVTADPHLGLQRVNQLMALNPYLSVNHQDFAQYSHPQHQYLVTLQQVKRSEQGVVALAEAVLEGQYTEVLSTASDAVMFNNITIERGSPKGLNKVLTEFVLPELARVVSAHNLENAWQALSEYACLIPNRRGYGGVEWVNEYLEQALSRQYTWIQQGQPYRGKPIMIKQNDYSLGLFNGDVGIIWADDLGELWAYFPAEQAGQFQQFSLYTLPAYDAVYAMTIHKTQGSEYKQVDIILPLLMARYLSRELLYTGITRAKKQLRIFADEQTIMAAITQKVQRVSGIESMLSDTDAK